MTNRILVVTGEDHTLLNDFRNLAVEYGLSVYWVREKKKPVKSRLGNTHKDRLPVHETRLGKLILAYMRTNLMRAWPMEDIGIMLEERDYRGTSASPTISRLAHEGYTMWVSAGIYRLTSLGRGDPERSHG